MSRWLQAVVLTIALLLVAAACVDDTENRQFANDPRAPRPTPTEEQAVVVAATPFAPARPVASPEALVDRRGAPRSVYTVVDDTLWKVSTKGLEQITADPVLAHAASPSGHQVAVLIAQDEASGYSLDLYTAEGELEQSFEDVLVLSPSATPADPGADEAAISLSWSPQGGRLLLAHGSGQLIDIQLDGSVETIETSSPITGVVEARWSPRGDQIGVVIRNEEGFGRLALLRLPAEPASVDVIAPVGNVSGERASIESFGWKPHGDGVLFLQGNPAEDGVRNGQIVSWDQASNSSQIMATGGQVGPTGSIQQFNIAPDGKAIAYEIDIATPEGWDFGGLFVRSLNFGQLYQVPVAPDVSVASFWWLDDGLAWMGDVEGDASGQGIVVRFVDGTGRQESIADVRTAPAATPAASPFASPIPGASLASPVASAVATPADAAATP